MPRVPDATEVLDYFQALSNWGRWGPDDELGTLNLITPAKRLEGLASVRDGISIGCARPVDQNAMVMLQSGETPDAAFAQESLTLVFHTLGVTHVDALSHYFWDGTFYNNRPRNRVTTDAGALECAVDTLADGIVTRGVLLDIARLLNRASLDAGEAIFPEQLEAAEREQGVRVKPGDALLIRTGWSGESVERPGLHAAALPWLRERDIALLAADAVQDVVPSGYTRPERPIHSVALVAMGLTLLDACQFEELSLACTERSRWEFAFVVAAPRLKRATGGPVTPLAIL